ncbi:Ig-like domain-containing protein, partial [Pseudoduganella ginsengisoli]
ATNVITLDNTGVQDSAGNAGSGSTSSSNYTVATVRPTATVALSDSALTAGETATVTITFSEAVTGLTTADLTVANGSIASLSSSDGGTTWTGTYTPTSSIEDTTNVITLDKTGVADSDGNTGSGTASSSNYTIDTLRPTATIGLSDT